MCKFSIPCVWLPDCSKLAINRKNDNDVTICWHDVIVNFSDVAMFLLSSFVTGPSFTSISLLALELQQFSFINDWTEIRKSKISRLSFAQCLETMVSYEYQIWHKCLYWNVTKCCKMLGLQLLPFLSY